MRNRLYQQFNCEQLRDLKDKNSFIWLMNYLIAPDANLWRRWALLRSFAYIKPDAYKNNNDRQFWQEQVINLIDTNIINSFNLDLSCYLAALSWGSARGNTLVESYIAINRKKFNSKDNKSSLVVMSINDRFTEIDDEIVRAWTGILRQYNLFQFLDYSYLINTNNYNRPLAKVSNAI